MSPITDEELGAKQLTDWYLFNKRELPWRQTTDPYRVWISETMLQQTTAQAVIPFYQRFIEVFPTLKSLAEAPIEKLNECWAGLGYYSRARNLHKAAKTLTEMSSFPESFEELIKLPGFGPYTARAVSSLAFQEPVGVVDGNTIRVMSRLYGLDVEWWKPTGRNVIQELMDLWVTYAEPSDLNQAMMELGATICRPTNPACLLCPVREQCSANRMGQPENYPSKKPKRERELWSWKPIIIEDDYKVLLVNDHPAPFLKNQWLLPGDAVLLKEKPEKFDFQHSITHHDIYVEVQTRGARIDPALLNQDNHLWIQKNKVHTVAPVSLIKKALSAF